MKVRTMRGKVVDMTHYINKHATMRAVGNAGMNARGDIINDTGAVVKSRADKLREYHAANPKAVKHVSLKSIADQVMTPAEAVAAARSEQPVEADAPRAKRKLVDRP